MYGIQNSNAFCWYVLSGFFLLSLAKMRKWPPFRNAEVTNRIIAINLLLRVIQAPLCPPFAARIHASPCDRSKSNSSFVEATLSRKISKDAAETKKQE